MNEESLFLAALERPTADERAAFLNEACEGDDGLRQRIESLLNANDRDELRETPGFNPAVDTPAPNLTSTEVGVRATSSSGVSSAPGTVIAGRYELLEEIGEGGMGTVWVAKQTAVVKRKVALKLIKPGMDSRQVLARFETERRALGLMNHPSIAKVYDGGLTDGDRPFFVMELINGAPITEYCDAARLSLNERLELFVSVCRAVHHAHQKGIVHRDLSPSNILVTRVDGKPVPKVIDFGVAKAVGGGLNDKSFSTQFGAVVGKLNYMSPEQAAFSAEDVDIRADIYSLGVILHELLLGFLPIEANQKSGLVEKLRIIREEEPTRPSTRLSSIDSRASLAALRRTEPKKLFSLLRRELDWVILKCLEKDRSRRYESASGLASEIERFLANEPLAETIPPSAGYRVRKFVGKYKRTFATATAFVLLLVAAVVVSTWQAVLLNKAEQDSRAKADREDKAKLVARSQRDRAELLVVGRLASGVESKLMQSGRIGEGLAAVGGMQRLTEDNAVDWMRKMLEKDLRILGLTLAFEPHAFNNMPKYCLYVVRREGEIKTVFLHDPKYNYDYLKRYWYEQAKDSETPFWSPGSFDTGGANQPMVAYLVPIIRGGKTIGVATVDLSLEGFFSSSIDGVDLRKELGLGENGYIFAVNHSKRKWEVDREGRLWPDGEANGSYLYHPSFEYPLRVRDLGKDPSLHPGVMALQRERVAVNATRPKHKRLPEQHELFKAMDDHKRRKVDQTYRTLMNAITNGEEKSGRYTAIDPATDKESTFLFARLPIADWTVVVVFTRD